MTSQALIELATRLAKDLKRWSEEATLRGAVSPDDLALLRQAADVVERATEKGVIARVNDTHLGFFKQSWASGWAEVRARPGSRVLDAYVWGKRGDFWTSPGSPPAWGTSNASQVDVTRRR